MTLYDQAESRGDALLRLHQSKVRLISIGWRFVEYASDGSGENMFRVSVSPPLTECSEDGMTFERRFYSDALDAALKFASHAQLRLEKEQGR